MDQNNSNEHVIKLYPTDSDLNQNNLPQTVDIDPYYGFTASSDWVKDEEIPGPMTRFPYIMKITNQAAGNGQQFCRYRPDMQMGGNARISVYLLAWSENQNPSVLYEVHHGGVVEKIAVDLTKVTRNDWYCLGEFDFTGPEKTNYVRVVPIPTANPDQITCASAVCFEVMNNASSKDVWQYLYISPIPAMVAHDIAELNVFKDIPVISPIKYDVEYLYNEGIITGATETTFEPDAPVCRADFAAWLANLLDRETASAASCGQLTGEEAAALLFDTIPSLNKAMAWLDELIAANGAATPTEKLACAGVTVPNGQLTRLQAALTLKQYAQRIVFASPAEDNADDKWVLTFYEDFDGDTLNTHVWTATDENPGHILSSRHPDDVEVHDGCCHLLIQHRSVVPGKEWTSGNAIANKGTFEQEYGYWECRYKYAAAPGINNSFWSISSNGITEGADDTWYENDINEGHYKNRINTNLHEFATNGTRVMHHENYRTQYDLSEDYHTYACLWTPETLKYYFDGKLIAIKDNVTNAGRPSFPRISAAVLNWEGTITDNADGTAQVVDYIRIWQRESDLAEHTILKPWSHTLKKVEEEGLKTHWICTECGMRFLDEAGTRAVELKDLTK